MKSTLHSQNFPAVDFTEYQSALVEFNGRDREMWDSTVFNNDGLLVMFNERITQTSAEYNTYFRIFKALTFEKVGSLLCLIKHVNNRTIN